MDEPDVCPICDAPQHTCAGTVPEGEINPSPHFVPQAERTFVVPHDIVETVDYMQPSAVKMTRLVARAGARITQDEAHDLLRRGLLHLPRARDGRGRFVKETMP